jgi:hypothetical protein
LQAAERRRQIHQNGVTTPVLLRKVVFLKPQNELRICFLKIGQKAQFRHMLIAR